LIGINFLDRRGVDQSLPPWSRKVDDDRQFQKLTNVMAGLGPAAAMSTRSSLKLKAPDMSGIRDMRSKRRR
jgi:hypothetical protein